MCEIRTVSAIRALWTVLGWRFILGERWILQDGLAGFQGVFKGKLCVTPQKNISSDSDLRAVSLGLSITSVVFKKGLYAMQII